MNHVSSLHRAGALTELDVQLAALLHRLDGRASEAASHVALAGALASHAVSNGHACLPLDRAAEVLEDGPPAQALPSPAVWRTALAGSPVCGDGSAPRPLVLDAGGRVYLYRYWRYEQALAAGLRARAGAQPLPDAARANTLLKKLFAGTDSADQRAAATAALRSRLCVITGGPGTGKTYTAVRIAALLAAGGCEAIRFAAPTGKAAQRMQEALAQARGALPVDEALRARLPAEAFTLHRLLGGAPGMTAFRHRAGHPLDADAVIVDEASMIDLPLFARFVAALAPATRLIVLGDHHQLRSIETGGVLGDVCEAGGPFADCVVTLRHGRRFADAPGLAALAEAIRTGDTDAALAALHGGGAVQREDSPAPGALPDRIRRWAGEEPVPASRDEALAGLARRRILCALRQGPWGASAANVALEEGRGPWYDGRPLLITENDYARGLFNGNTGVVWADSTGQPRAWFDQPGGLVDFPPARLPAHAPCHAMTIHKSQGSEFDRVLVILPDRDHPLLARELLYTAATRARRQLLVIAPESVLRAALARRATRFSGLPVLLSA